MAGSFRRRLLAITALAALACVGAIVAMVYLARTSTEERIERAHERVALEIERLRDLSEVSPRSERGRARRNVAELRSGWLEDANSVDRRNPLVAQAVRAAEEKGEVVILDLARNENTPMIVGAAPAAGGGYVYAALRVVTGREMRTLRATVLVLSILSLVLVVVSLQTVAVVDRGVSTLRGSFAAVAKDLHAPVARPKLRELDELAGGLAALAQELAGAQKERERLTRELDEKERLAALGRVAAGIAHEVRNPLAAMKLRADLAQSSGEASPAIAKDLKDIGAEISRLDRLVGDLLVVAGRRVGVRAKTDIGQLVETRVRLLAAWAATMNVKVEATGSATLDVDADAVIRAIDNLLRNAIEASSAGGLVQASVEARADGSVVVTVVDRGAGVPGDRVPRLFEPFFTTKPEGTGLGLALARAVAQAHGGSLTYAREADATRFTLLLPRIAADPPIAAEQA
jgi:signal transduction histidine kinase